MQNNLRRAIKESKPRRPIQESIPEDHLTRAIQERTRGEQSLESNPRRAIP
jgi:hypothetical protein